MIRGGRMKSPANDKKALKQIDSFTICHLQLIVSTYKNTQHTTETTFFRHINTR